MGEFDKKIAIWLRRAWFTGLLLLLLILLLRLFLDYLLPFTAAFFLAFTLSPLIKRLEKHTRVHPRFLRALLLLSVLGLLAFLVVLGCLRLFNEAKDFFLSLYDNLDSLLAYLFSFLEKIREKLPENSLDTVALSSLLSEGLKNIMSEISAYSASAAARLAAKLPSLLFALFLFILALFYCFLDYERISAYLSALVPPKHREKLSHLKRAFFSTLARYAKAYLLLFLFTFVGLLIAFLLLRVDYAFLLALLSAALDVLPAIGIGIVLIPWALFLVLSGETGRALAILALYLIMTLLRQIVEPHIIGAHFGVHPLASLMALYLGFRLFGLFGILLSPWFALVLSQGLSLYRKKIEQNTPPTPS